MDADVDADDGNGDIKAISVQLSWDLTELGKKEVQFVDQAEQVGMVGANEGYIPSIFKKDFSFQEISWESCFLWFSKSTQIQPSSLPSHHVHLLHTCIDVRFRKPSTV